MKDENIFLGKHFFLQLLLIQTALRISISTTVIWVCSFSVHSFTIRISREEFE